MSDTLIVYSFEPSAAACTRCASMQRYSRKFPARPHPNCKCGIDSFIAKVTLVARTEIEMLPSDRQEVLIGINPPKGCFEDSITQESTEEVGWEIGGSGFGLSGGSESKTIKTHKQTICHTENCDKSEGTWAIYEVQEYLIESLYVAEGSFLGPSEATWMEYGRRTKVRLVNIETRCIE